MKFLFIVIIFCLCVFVGWVFSKKYLKRKRFFNSLISLCEKLSLEINFSRERLRVLMENFDEKQKKDLLGVVEEFNEYLEHRGELDETKIFKNASILKPDEKSAILLFLKTLGRSDVENQTKEIGNFIARFSEMKTVCDAEQKKYGALSIKLGVIAGLFFVVILF